MEAHSLSVRTSMITARSALECTLCSVRLLLPRALPTCATLTPAHVLPWTAAAPGKGVVVARTVEEAYQAVDDMLVNKVFGGAGAYACGQRGLRCGTADDMLVHEVPAESGASVGGCLAVVTGRRSGRLAEGHGRLATRTGGTVSRALGRCSVIIYSCTARTSRPNREGLIHSTRMRRESVALATAHTAQATSW